MLAHGANPPSPPPNRWKKEESFGIWRSFFAFDRSERSESRDENVRSSSGRSIEAEAVKIIQEVPSTTTRWNLRNSKTTDFSTHSPLPTLPDFVPVNCPGSPRKRRSSDGNRTINISVLLLIRPHLMGSRRKNRKFYDFT